MSGKKKGHEGHIDESWLIPYADLLTLLLALFIVLFAASNVDKEKYEKIMMSFYSEFHPMQSSGGNSEVGFFLPGESTDLTELSPPPFDNDPTSDPSQEYTPSQRMFNSIFEYIDTNNLSDEIQVRLMEDAVLLTLTSDIWFASGSAQISTSQRETAKKLSDLVEASYTENMEIVITGHTDNIPISTAQYRSNWYLSATRAINFMEVMLEDGVLDPRMFSARGYGEFDPVADNNTAEGRKLNRRVEVLVSVN